MIEAYVYHIKDPDDPSINSGYIGVVKSSKGIHKRFREHCKTVRMGEIISKHNVSFENVEVIFEGTRYDCQELEKKLRPTERMGWNLASGGSGYNYTKIEDISKFRSDLQSSRMQNDALREKQGKSFKENYYSDASSIALRKHRAKEHMSDPIKKSKCISAMHAKVKCPYCDFTTNHGNMKRHIKSKHDS